VKLAEVTLAHCVRNIYTTGIEAVNVLTKMQDSSALAEGVDVPPSVVQHITAERARLEDEREVLRQGREGLEKEKDEQAKANADLRAQLAALSAQKADLEKRLLSWEGEVKKLRKEAGVVPKLKEELGTLQEVSSKILLDFLCSNTFQVAALNLAKPAMLDQLHTTISYISELFSFKPEEFGVTETMMEPPSFTGFKWNRETGQLISGDGVALSVSEIHLELGSMQPKTPWFPEDEAEEEEEGAQEADVEEGQQARRPSIFLFLFF
jgi:hypothetical protein